MGGHYYRLLFFVFVLAEKVKASLQPFKVKRLKRSPPKQKSNQKLPLAL